MRGSFLLLVPLFLLEEFIDELYNGELVAPHRCLLSIEVNQKTMQGILKDTVRHLSKFSRCSEPLDPCVLMQSK